MRRLVVLSLVALVLAVAGATLWSSRAAADDPRLFANRVWVERSPKSDRDLVLRLIAVDAAGRKAGVVHRSSKYAFGGEVFSWSLESPSDDPQKQPTLVLKLPQEQVVARLAMRSWACANEAPAGFDLCLELSDGRNKLRLFSRKGWGRPRSSDLPVDVDAMSLPSDVPEGYGVDREVGIEALTDSI